MGGDVGPRATFDGSGWSWLDGPTGRDDVPRTHMMPIHRPPLLGCGDRALGGAGRGRQHPRGDHIWLWDQARLAPRWHPAMVCVMRVARAGGRVTPATTWWLCSESLCPPSPSVVLGGAAGSPKSKVEATGQRSRCCRP